MLLNSPLRVMAAGIAGILLAIGAMSSPLRHEAPIAAAVLQDTKAGPLPSAPSFSGGKALQLDRQRDGLFYATLNVEGKPIRFLVDTGASMTILSSNDAAKLGKRNLKADAVALRTVGGSTQMMRTRLDHIHLAGHDMRAVEVAVVNSGLPVSLLGQDLLAKMDLVAIADHRMVIR